MADFILPIDKGNNTAHDPTRLKPGFLVRTHEFIYMPDDLDRLHKMPGRTLAGTKPAGLSSLDGIVYCQYDNAADVIVSYGDDGAGTNFLYRATASTTLGAWVEIDGPAAASDIHPTGSFLKAIPDGRNRWILWTGGQDDRPVVMDFHISREENVFPMIPAGQSIEQMMVDRPK